MIARPKIVRESNLTLKELFKDYTEIIDSLTTANYGVICRVSHGLPVFFTRAANIVSSFFRI
jgi:hypothetical protein